MALYFTGLHAFFSNNTLEQTWSPPFDYPSLMQTCKRFRTMLHWIFCLEFMIKLPLRDRSDFLAGPILLRWPPLWRWWHGFHQPPWGSCSVPAGFSAQPNGSRRARFSFRLSVHEIDRRWPIRALLSPRLISWRPIPIERLPEPAFLITHAYKGTKKKQKILDGGKKSWEKRTWALISNSLETSQFSDPANSIQSNRFLNASALPGFLERKMYL